MEILNGGYRKSKRSNKKSKRSNKKSKRSNKTSVTYVPLTEKMADKFLKDGKNMYLYYRNDNRWTGQKFNWKYSFKTKNRYALWYQPVEGRFGYDIKNGVVSYLHVRKTSRKK